MQHAALQRAQPISYSKWDMLDDSDDDKPLAGDPSAAMQPLLDQNKSVAQHHADECVAARFIPYMEQHLPELPLQQRQLAARFIAASNKGDESNNIFRYSDIVAFCARYSAELLSTTLIDAMCVLHTRMVTKVHGDKTRTKDLEYLMDAINTLEACRRHDNAAHFFEAVCQPSCSARSRVAAEAYSNNEFGKRAMLRTLFQDQDIDREAVNAGEVDLDHLLSGDARRPSKLQGSWVPRCVDPRLRWRSALFVVILALLTWACLQARAK